MKKLKCSTCKKEKSVEGFYRDKGRSRGYGYQCKECHKVYERYVRGKNLANLRRKVEPQKYKARTAIMNAIASGKIKKENCFLCGNKNKVEGHYLSYDFPMKVVWLCRNHHIKIHYIKKYVA